MKMEYSHKMTHRKRNIWAHKLNNIRRKKKTELIGVESVQELAPRIQPKRDSGNIA